ncbi:MAG: hypothetical protein Q9160_006651 [Pyrenula sp. 1 TL-2023]
MPAATAGETRVKIGSIGKRRDHKRISFQAVPWKSTFGDVQYRAIKFLNHFESLNLKAQVMISGQPIPKNPSDLPDFQYDPLPSPSSIWLLYLSPATEDQIAREVDGVLSIDCTLTPIDLNDKPPYDALSYRWGSLFAPDSPMSAKYAVIDTLPIIVNERTVQSTSVSMIFSTIFSTIFVDAEWYRTKASPKAVFGLMPFVSTPIESQ